MDALGGAFYIGTGCFHQREILYGRKYSKDYKFEWNMQNGIYVEGKVDELEDKAKGLASCTYEMNTQWGKEVRFLYFFLSQNANDKKLKKLGFVCKIDFTKNKFRLKVLN